MSLRDIGYDFDSAVADLVDNSISAGSHEIDIEVRYEGADSYVTIADDGCGMHTQTLDEAMRFGTRREYAAQELGKFGLGLKTASLSQARRLTVVTRTAPQRARARMRTLDLDHILRTDRWEVLSGPTSGPCPWAEEVRCRIERGSGTVVVLDRLDRLFPDSGPSSAWAKRRLSARAAGLHNHLGMVFHRHLEGTARGYTDRALSISVNGEKIRPWNPFAPSEPHRVELRRRQFELVSEDGRSAMVHFSPAVLPAQSLFSSPDEFERLAGPAQWNRQQGLYSYRCDRLIQSGGWCGIRAIDEHTKLARAAIDFDPVLDESFRVDVAKMRVTLPQEVRTLLGPEVGALCKRAQLMYRRDRRENTGEEITEDPQDDAGHGSVNARHIGLALLSAASTTGDTEALIRIVERVRADDPDTVTELGW